jgi:hypothetical protein
MYFKQNSGTHCVRIGGSAIPPSCVLNIALAASKCAAIFTLMLDTTRHDTTRHKDKTQRQDKRAEKHICVMMSKVGSSLLNLSSSSGMITARIRRTPLRHRKQIAKQSSRGQPNASVILQRATTISEFDSEPTASHQEAKRQT